MFKLINPLLGSTCSIGRIGDPAVLNPSLTPGTAEIMDAATGGRPPQAWPRGYSSAP
jgi:hypothetical protein